MRMRVNRRLAIFLTSILVLIVGSSLAAYSIQKQSQTRGLLILADTAEASGEIDRARRLLEEYLVAFPKDHATRARYGILMESLARDEKGLLAVSEVYKQVLEAQPEQDDIRNRLVKIYVVLGYFADARPHLELLKAESSTNPETVFLLGLCYEAGKEWDKAESQYRRVITLDPKLIEPTMRLANLLRNPPKSRPTEADLLVDNMVKLLGNAEAHLTRAIYRRDKKVGNVLDDVNSAEKLAPRNVGVRVLAAELSKELSDKKRHLLVAYEEQPGNEQVVVMLADVEYQLGNKDQALQLYRKALVRRPGSATLLFGQLDLQLAEKKLDDAEKTLAEIQRWKLYPERVLLLQARKEMLRGNWRLAKTMLQDGRSLLTTSSNQLAIEVDRLIGQCQQQLGEDELALETFKRAEAVDPQRQDIKELIAQTYFRLGQIDPAVSYYQTLATNADASMESTLLYAQLRVYRYLSRPEKDRRAEEIKPIIDELEHKFPGKPEVVLLRTAVMVSQSQIEDARKILQEILDRQPDALPIGIELARILRLQGDMKSAWNVLDNLLAKTGPSLDLDLANLEFLTATETRFEKILSEVEKRFVGLTDVNNKVRLANAIADACVRCNMLDMSNRWLKEITEIQPQNLASYLRLYDLALQKGNQDELDKILANIRKIEGSDGPFGNVAESIRYIKVKAAPEALAKARMLLKSAESKRPSWNRVHAFLGAVAELESKPQEAATEYTTAVFLGDRSPRTVRSAVQVLVTLRRYKEADNLLQGIRPETQDAIGALLIRLAAQVTLANNENERAAKFAIDAIPKTSNIAEDFLWQGEVLSHAGRGEDAVVSYRKCISLETDKGKYWIALLRHYVRYRQLEKADSVLKELDKALKGPERLLTLGLCYEALGQIPVAAEQFAAMLQAAPLDVTVVRPVTEFYFRNQAARQAISPLGTLLKAGNSLPPYELAWVRQALARALASTGKYDAFQESLELLDQNLRADTSSVEDLVLKARVLALRPSRRLEALEQIEQAKKKRPLTPESQFLHGQLLTETGLWTTGRPFLVEAILKSPDSVEFLNYFIERLLWEEQTTEAGIWLKNLETIAPQELITLRLRIQYLVKQNQTTPIPSLVRKFVGEVKPTRPEDFTRIQNLAKCLEEVAFKTKAGEAQKTLFSLAEEFHRQAASSESDQAKINLIGFLGATGQIDECLKLLRENESKLPSLSRCMTLSSVAYSSLPLSSEQLGKIEVAFETELKSAKFPDRLAHTIRGPFLIRLGQYQKAADEFRNALKFDKDNPALLNNLAYSLAMTNSSEAEALASLERAAQISGESAELMDTRGLVHYFAGRNEQALADFKQANAWEPSASRCLHLALAYQKAGTEEAERTKLKKRLNSLLPDASLTIPKEAELLKSLK